jgi:hypothetical protein
MSRISNVVEPVVHRGASNSHCHRQFILANSVSFQYLSESLTCLAHDFYLVRGS